MKIIKYKIIILLLAVTIAANNFYAEDEFEEFKSDDLESIEIIEDDEFKEMDVISDSINKNKNNDIFKIIIDNNVHFLIIAILLGFISFYFKKNRFRYIILLVSLGFLGFYVGGCNCSVGSFIKFFYNIFYDKGNLIIASIMIGVPIISTLFFGRIFCGYVCPIGALQEFVAIRDKLIKIDYRVERVLKHLRILLFAVLLVVTFTTHNFVFSKIAPFKTVFNMNGTIIQFVIAGVILLISLFVYRPFCRFACPLSLALELAGKVSLFKLKKDKDYCGTCKNCIKKCPVNALTKDCKIDHGSCIRCGECLDCIRPNVEFPTERNKNKKY